VIDEQERAMVRNVFRLDDRQIASLMTPRSDIVYLDLDDSIDDNLRKVVESEHARFPVCRGTLREVQGIVSARTLLKQAVQGGKMDLATAQQPVVFVPESLTGMELLDNFRASSSHVALARFVLPRHAVQNRDVEQVRHQRRQPKAPAGAPTQAVAQQGPGTGHFLEIERAGVAGAQVDPDHLAHAAHLPHHVGREVVEGAAVAQQVAFAHHRRQGTRNGKAGQQRLAQIALGQAHFLAFGVVAGNAEVALPQVHDVGRAPGELLQRLAHDAARPHAP
jgi:hypothetical protein